MTATDDRPPITCPAWCQTGPNCRGDHWQASTYLAATGHSTPYVSHETGTVFLAVGVGLTYSQLEGDDAPAVALHITGTGPLGNEVHQDVFLRAHEAEAVAKAILERVAVLRGR